MSWADKVLRAVGVQRIQNNTIITGNSDSLSEIFSLEPSYAGPHVSPETAMRLSVVYACTRLIAGAIASLPIKVYHDATPVRGEVSNSPLARIFNERPTDRFTAASFWEFIVTSMLLRGDGFAYLVRNGNGQVVGAVPVHADNIVVQRETTGEGVGKQSRLHYYINDNGDYFGVQQDDMLHFPGFGYGFGLGYGVNSLRGMSVVRYAAHQAVGIALAAEETSARFFGGGMTPKYVLQAEGKLSDDQVVKLRESWDRRYGGSANAGKPLILTEGLEAKTLSLSAADSQLLDSRKFQVVDIARAFGVPPHMVGDMEKTTSWGTGIGEMNVGFLTYTLQPHLTRFEQEINAKCFSSRTFPRQFVEFNVRGLLRADAKAQNEAYRQAVGGSQGPGWMTLNEVRGLNNDPPLPGGEVLYDPAKAVAPAKDPAMQARMIAMEAREPVTVHNHIAPPAVTVEAPIHVAQPAVNIAATTITVEQPVNNVTVEAAQAPQVTISDGAVQVNLPAEKPVARKVTRYERDERGEIIRAVEEE